MSNSKITITIESPSIQSAKKAAFVYTIMFVLIVALIAITAAAVSGLITEAMYIVLFSDMTSWGG